MPVHTCACVKGEKELRLKVFSPASVAVRTAEAEQMSQPRRVTGLPGSKTMHGKLFLNCKALSVHKALFLIA